MSLNETLGLQNFRDHSLLLTFLEKELEPELSPTDDPTESEVFEAFLSWLEDGNNYE